MYEYTRLFAILAIRFALTVPTFPLRPKCEVPLACTMTSSLASR